MKHFIWTLMIAAACSGCLHSRPPAPEFDVHTIAGDRLSSADLKGKVVVVDFWATWCRPCVMEIPGYNTLSEDTAGTDVEVLGVAVESGSQDDLKARVRELGIKYPVVMGAESLVHGFGGYAGVPTTFIVGKDWKVYRKIVGFSERKHAQIRDTVARLLKLPEPRNAWLAPVPVLRQAGSLTP
jgi:thiol-disulfide isomerase/thioredoxin